MMMRYCILISVFQLACSSESEPVSFPDDIVPLEEIKVDAPAGTDADPYPETFNLLSNNEDDYAWGHLRGYIHTDMAQAWAAIRNDLVYINHRSMTAEGSGYVVEEINLEQYHYVYQVDNTVKDLITVEFRTEWRHLALEGTQDAPEKVGVRWKKIEGADGIIDLLEGSIQILPVADGRKDIVEVQVIEHMTALREQEENTIQYLEDLFERWVLVSKGSDIPTYEEE